MPASESVISEESAACTESANAYLTSSTMYETVLSRQLYGWISSVLSILAVILGTNVVVLSLSKQTAELSAYRYFIMNFVIWDMGTSIFAVATSMQLVPTETTLVIGQEFFEVTFRRTNHRIRWKVHRRRRVARWYSGRL